MLLTVRELIERVAHLDDDTLIAIRKFAHASDRGTLTLLDKGELDVDTIFVDGEDKNVVILCNI